MIGLGVPVRWPLVLALAVAAGCGQSDGASSAPPRTSATATATIAEIAPTAGELAGRIAGSLAGVHTVTATVSLGAPGGASALAATLALDTDATAADIDVRTAGGDHDRVRIRDGVVYLRGPGVASLTHGRPWIRAGLDEVVGLAAAGGSPAVAGGQQGLPQPDRVAALLLGSLSPGVPHAAAYGTSTGPHYPVTMPLSTVEQLGAALDLSPRTPAGARVSAWTNRLGPAWRHRPDRRPGAGSAGPPAPAGRRTRGRPGRPGQGDRHLRRLGRSGGGGGAVRRPGPRGVRC